MAGGNYGGNSTPTTPVGGAELLAGKSTTYKDYLCTSIVSSAASGTFGYKGETYSVGAIGQTVDLIVKPGDVTAQSGVYFLCYKCSCDGPMTGNTAPNNVYNYPFYSGMTGYRAPSFLGMGGSQN
jgi:hypothetical protein